MTSRRTGALLVVSLCVALVLTVDDVASARPEQATDAAVTTGPVTTEVQLRRAWADPLRTRIDLGADIALRDCASGDPMRESPYPMLLDGHGFTIRQTCFEQRILRQDGTGWLDIRDVTLTRGGSDGPGAALTSRGEILLQDCVIKQNLSEEPGGGVFSMRRVTARRCRINGNLANDDGGGIYARRGGVQIYDSVLSTNLVDGSGGAIGSTGDILVVDSWVDGNTTDGDGGALYADEDGDVTVIRSLIDGSDADGPGGGIFTLDGDVAVFDSTLNGNRADDRGGAIAGEGDVLVVNSTVGRNLAVAHAGGGIWSRGNLVVVNSTIARNYAEGMGGGTLSAGRTTIIGSTLVANIASVGGDIGSAGRLDSFGSVIGPPATEGVTGDTIPTWRSCRVYGAASAGFNYVADPSCELDHATDIEGADPELLQVDALPLGFVMVPRPGSPVIGRIPSGSCVGELPDPLPAGQLLEDWVDWDEVLRHDTLGQVRDDGISCDIGAVESGGVVGAPALTRLRSPDVPPLGPESPPAVRRAPPVEHVVDPRPGPVGLRGALARLEERLAVLERGSRRFGVLLGCTTRIGVDRAGDARHRWGFRYDERDGTGLDLRPALVRHRRGGTPARWHLLALDTARRCLSAPADPNGAGDDARPSADSLRATLHRLQRTAATVERRTRLFDRWESCLSWLPVTESGDDEQDLGYLADQGMWPFERVHYPAVDLDRSEWDDPDYQVLALRGTDRPLRRGECGSDPGESPDRPAPSDRELRRAIASLREDVADLRDPVDEIVRFDECLYTVGLAESPGYLYRDRAGQERRRPALSFDLSGPQLPQLSVLAFPGEEPPQIECNEDAGGIQTHE